MKLAIVRQRYNAFGGAERFVARSLAALERAGAQVTLITRKEQGWGARRVLRVDPFYIGNLWRDWSFARAARKAWRREGFDVVQSHERIPGCDVYRAGDGVHRRWLELRNSSAGLWERVGVLLNPYHGYVCRAEKRMFEHPRLRAVICNSKMVCDEVRRAFRIAPEKLHVIYSGVDLEHFHPRSRERLRGAARAELGCAPRDTVFLHVGSGFARKGLDAALDALALAANPAFWLVVVGEDRERARYERKAKASGKVIFLGGLEDVRPLYAAADCLILPSRYDPFPNTVLEALAMGLPAIVSTRCGAAEIIQPGVDGWVCEPDDGQALARLLHAADEAIRSAGMEQNARASAARFAMDATAQRLAELYASL
ncbi:MAG TPA: glycosyltransferase family 4 protein [Burkholderiales bacterium]|jgi:UDP-glucose:(heptosyl)LPS alpha-1,3-glucosyltransferase|nr:glycosyltransferase family 4 protein [Burkholderiales bacterium]